MAPGMDTGEYSPDFKALVLGGIRDLKDGQNKQGDRITNMHVRQDRVEALLVGTIDNPDGGLVGKIKRNDLEIGYIKKAKDRTRAIWTAIFTSVVAAIILGAVVAAVKFGM